MNNDRSRIEQSIAALEAQRAILGNDVVELALSALYKQLQELGASTEPEEQRKLVTVLFADLPALAILSEKVDAEDLSDAMNTLWQHIDETIISFGGKIDKHIGHGVMALWGAEHAREDDPERALHAALAMHRAMETLSTSHAIPGSITSEKLALRIGVNTGNVILSRVSTTQEYTAIGDAVNIASRLQNAAQPRSTIISHDTYRHVRGVFDVQELAPIEVKGKKEPIQVYRVLQAKPRALRKGTRGVEGIEIRMVGREQELHRLQEIYHLAFHQNQCQVVTITGDAGIGKSRLMHESDIWSELQPETFFLFKANSHQETQNLPYALIRDLLISRFQVFESDSAAVIRQKIEIGVREALIPEQVALPTLAERAIRQAHFIGQLIGYDFTDSPYIKNTLGDADQLRDRALAYLEEYFRGLAAQSPILIFLEDLQWTDNSSLDMISAIAQALRRKPVLIICTARPTLLERRSSWIEQANHTHLALSPLTRRESLRLVNEILQRVDQPPDALREMIVGNAEGNPFYVEELIKMLIEDGVIVKGQETWSVNPGRLVAVKVPPTLTGLLQARFDSLPAEEKNALQRASVIGRIFWDDALAFLSQGDIKEPEDVEMGEILTTLRQREMIFQRDASTFANVIEYIFKHTLLRDTIYESVLKRDRRAFHARVADWLINHSGSHSADFAGLIAEHLERAGIDEKAAAFLNQAAENALNLSAYLETLEFSQRALALLPENSPARILSNLYAGEALLGRSDYVASRRHLEEALRLARQYNDEPNIIRSLVKLGWILRNRGQYHEALTLLEESLALARKTDDRLGAAQVLSSLGWVDIKMGEYAKARQWLTESEIYFRQRGSSVDLAYVLIGLGIVARKSREYELADKFLIDALSVNREIGNRGGMASCFTSLGETARLQGHYATARSYYKAALDLDREIGDLLGAAIDLGNLGHASVADGKFTEAIPYYREGLEMVMPTGAIPYALDILAGLSDAMAHTNQFENALELAGLTLNHPALMEETRPLAETAFEYIKTRLSPEMIQTGLEGGMSQDIEAWVQKFLSEKGRASATM